MSKQTLRRFAFGIFLLGAALVASGALILIITFYPIIKAELLYGFSHAVKQSNTASAKAVKPLDEEFGIVIPKIGANARIVPNINAYDSHEYQVALAHGVAHARGTVFPGEIGNIFLFSHSSVNFYDALRYNSIFYLLTKMETGDEVYLYYNKVKFVYRVTGKKFVAATDVSYLTAQTTKKTLTLMTCWPPGTSLKRLLVLAEIAPR